MSPKITIPIHLFDASTTANEKPVSLPPEVFSDPQFFNFEMDAVWGHEWFCIGHVNEIPNAGDYYTISVGKDPLMVVAPARWRGQGLGQRVPAPWFVAGRRPWQCAPHPLPDAQLGL